MCSNVCVSASICVPCTFSSALFFLLICLFCPVSINLLCFSLFFRYLFVMRENKKGRELMLGRTLEELETEKV